jgi:hypothetical protein
MRRLGGWLLVLVGLVLAGSGAAAAVVIGPDDGVESKTEHIDSPGAAIVTGPGAIEYAGPTLRLDVTSQNGPVFVGVGSEVDVEDFVSDVSHTEVDEIDLPSDIQKSFVRGSQAFLAEGPDLDWWVESATGEHAEVEFTLPDEPVSVVVMNADGASSVVVDVKAAVSVRGVFWGAVAMIVVGLGLLILGVLALRRGRPRREPDVDTPTEGR